MIESGLQGKVALVTGANSPVGIGAAIADALARQGADVFVTYLRQDPQWFGVTTDDSSLAEELGEAYYRARNADPPDAVLDRLRVHGGRVASSEADLADPASIPRLFDAVEETLGPVDVLVNNAAYCVPDTLLPADRGAETKVPGGFSWLPFSADGHDRHFAVNSRAPAIAMAEYVRRHVDRVATWGRIINVSTDGARGFPGEVSYGASKLALESYSRAAAVEFGPHGVTVNVVSLAAVQTGWISPQLEDGIASDIPLRRLGTPADVADVVVFFASEQARWVTGQVLYVGGGHAM